MMTCEELQHLSAGYGRAEFEKERIPTLGQVLERLPDVVAVALALKSDDFFRQDVCCRLLQLLRETKTLNRAIVLSFSLTRLDAVRRFAPQIPTGAITLGRIAPDQPGEVIGPWWPIVFVNPFYVWMAHRRGQLVAPLDPTPESRLWYYRFLGCDALLTNDPAKTLRALGRSQD